ncbi:MAG: hypothetical protein IKW64_01395 [Clostridia bacterium]|nr:hypothetical protein [Clostridia bacterium]
MEIFVEEMVAKKKTAAFFARTLGLVAACFVAVMFLMTVVTALVPAFAPFVFLVSAAAVYGTYILITAGNVEFEYSLVNNEIDVDKIMSRRKRKRLTTANLRELEAFGTKANPDYERYLKDPSAKKIFACEDKNADNVFFLVYNENTLKKMLIFSPGEKITAVVARFNPKTPII